jgi:glycosyltransferase involved in cell wall biosynthesis
LTEDALARGQAALALGDRAEAMRWLDRARRLAPNDMTIRLVLAAAAVGHDNARAASLFTQVLDVADSWDAWFGLASARFLLREFEAARAALTMALGRHAMRREISRLAERVSRAAGAPGWCGLTGDGVVVAEPISGQPIDLAVDGKPLLGRDLPSSWPRRRWLTVMDGDAHLLGSPISLRAIGRVEGHVEATRRGIRGWAWCPGDPGSVPRVRVDGRDIETTEAVPEISGLPPLARPRGFIVAWRDIAGCDASVHVRGRDGRELRGSPVSRSRPSTPRRPTPSADAPRLARWPTDDENSVIIVTHDDGGGVERQVQAAIAAHEQHGQRAIVLRPAKPSDGSVLVSAAGRPTLRFALPRDRAALLRQLRAVRPVATELHHFLNHHPSIFEIIHTLGVPYDAYVHDYTWFCPRVALVGRGDRYCGEPPPKSCAVCVNTFGTYLSDPIGVDALLKRSRLVLARARRVIAPSADAAARMSRHFVGIHPESVPHEDDDAIAEPPPIPRVSGTVVVCVAGGIGVHKGYDVLLGCARDAAKRALDLRFVVVGTTIGDQRLIDTGRVFITGPYQQNEVVALVREQSAALALLPSIWPETWCLTLGELWRAGLRVAAFDIGAPAARIRNTGRGFLLPLNDPPRSINNALLNAAKSRNFASGPPRFGIQGATIDTTVSK